MAGSLNVRHINVKIHLANITLLRMYLGNKNKTKSIEASGAGRNEAFFLCIWFLTGIA